MENDNDYNIKFKPFVDKYKAYILPILNRSSYKTQLSVEPYSFIKCMLFMNSYLEDNGLKSFQPISLRTDIKDKYIPINTNALVDIFNFKNKQEYFFKIRDYADYIWNKVFCLS